MNNLIEELSWNIFKENYVIANIITVCAKIKEIAKASIAREKNMDKEKRLEKEKENGS